MKKRQPKTSKEERDNLEKDRDMHLKRRDRLDDARMKHSESLDKYLLTFATGSLYLSIHFTGSLEGNLESKCLLSLGWIALLLSIAMTLLSFYFGEKAHSRQIHINDEVIKLLDGEKIEPNYSNHWNGVVETLTILSIVGFFAGVSLLTYFYFVNL
jgi:hypothetical protein